MAGDLPDPDRAAVIARLAAAHPLGVLLRTCEGAAWNKHWENCVFRRLKPVAGAKHALDDFRHSFAQRKWQEGHDHSTVAELLGHKDSRHRCSFFTSSQTSYFSLASVPDFFTRSTPWVASALALYPARRWPGSPRWPP